MESITSITLLILAQSLVLDAFFGSAITYASVLLKKLIKSSFNMGHDSRIVYSVLDILCFFHTY